jgi:hypothetical protein
MIRTVLKDCGIASRGGNPLIVNGKVSGAIGVSGGTGSQDNLLSLVGVDSLKIRFGKFANDPPGLKFRRIFLRLRGGKIGLFKRLS